MPKRYGNIYSKITSIDNIKNAHQHAKKDKTFYTAVKKTDKHLDERIKEIQELLIKHTYEVSDYKIALIQDKNKRRVLYKLPYYPDRIIQWAIMLQIEPIFRKIFTDFTYASIPNKGIHKASRQLTKWINTDIKNTKYCLKIDIKKFYPSIDREILKQLLRKKFKDKDLLIELDKIIDSMNNCDISHLDLTEEEKKIYSKTGKGLPVGSYLSQYLANYYLSFFDHWIKEELHCKYVLRYMDDIIILSDNKDFLWNVFYLIKEYLMENLQLEIKDNYQIFPVDARSIDFIGYRHFRGYTLLRKTTLKNFKKNAILIKNKNNQKLLPSEKEWCAWVSSIGWLIWSDSKKFLIKYYKDSIPIINTYYTLNKKGKNQSVSKQFLIFGNIKYKKIYYNNFQHQNIHKKR